MLFCLFDYNDHHSECVIESWLLIFHYHYSRFVHSLRFLFIFDCPLLPIGACLQYCQTVCCLNFHLCCNNLHVQFILFTPFWSRLARWQAPFWGVVHHDPSPTTEAWKPYEQDIYPFRSIKHKQQFDLIFHVRYQHIPTSSPMNRANIKPMWFIDCTTCLLAKPHVRWSKPCRFFCAR